MTSINGLDPNTLAAEALQVAQQNQQSTVNTGSASTTNLLSKLNSLYGSDGTNKSTNPLAGIAGALGIDPTTLASELQGANKAKAAKLIADQMTLTALHAVNSDSDPNSDNGSSSDSADPSSAALGGNSTSSTDTSSQLQSILDQMGSTGTMYNGQL